MALVALDGVGVARLGAFGGLVAALATIAAGETVLARNSACKIQVNNASYADDVENLQSRTRWPSLSQL